MYDNRIKLATVYKVNVSYIDLFKALDWAEAHCKSYVSVELGAFIDYDGSGHLLIYRDGDYYPLGEDTWPSIVDKIPSEATHIDWFNR